MNIIKELTGSFSSKVFLVEEDGRKMVWKQTDDPEWVVSEKKIL